MTTSTILRCGASSAGDTAPATVGRMWPSNADLAFYQDGAAKVYLEEFHHNGLAIRCAQIARVPHALVGSWTRRRLSEQTQVLLQTRGTDIRQHLITDLVPFTEASGFLADLATRQRHTLQAVFTFPDQAPA